MVGFLLLYFWLMGVGVGLLLILFWRIWFMEFIEGMLYLLYILLVRSLFFIFYVNIFGFCFLYILICLIIFGVVMCGLFLLIVFGKMEFVLLYLVSILFIYLWDIWSWWEILYGCILSWVNLIIWRWIVFGSGWLLMKMFLSWFILLNVDCFGRKEIIWYLVL